jgi:cysteine desulfurase family protein (TIGR01976 family)
MHYMTPQLDLSFVRSHFPALSGTDVFLDNGGGTQVLAEVIARAADYLTTTNVQPVQSLGGRAAAGANRLLGARRRLAAWVNAEFDEEVVLGSSTTLLLHLLAESVGKTLVPGDEIIVTDFDHEANIGPWMRLQAAGITIRTWRVRTPSYTLSVDDLHELLTSRTRLVCVCHCSNLFGTINPIESIADVVHRRGAWLCVDGVGLAPHREIDVQRLKADFYVFSLYKTFGPHYALLYSRRSILRSLPGLNHFFIDQHSVPYKLQPGGTVFELVYAAAGIVDYLERLGAHMTQSRDPAAQRAAAYAGIAAHERALTEPLLAFLNSRPDVVVIGNRGTDECVRVPIISFVVNGRDSREISEEIAGKGLSLRYGTFYAYRYCRDQGLDARHGVLRASFAHYNSLEDVGQLIDVLKAVL